MADGFAMISDLSALDKNLENTAKKSEEVSKRIVKAFQNVSKDGVTPLIDDIKNLNNKIKELGGKSSKKNPLESVSKGAAKAVDDVNKVAFAIDKIIVNGSAFSNSALSKVNIRIEYLRNQLKLLREEESRAMSSNGNQSGIRPLASIGEQQSNISKELELLRKERSEIIETSRIKIQKSQEEREIQRGRDAEWKRMSDERVSTKRKEAEEILRIEAETLSKNHSVVERITGENIKTKNRALEHEKKAAAERERLLKKQAEEEKAISKIREQSALRNKEIVERASGQNIQSKSRIEHHEELLKQEQELNKKREKEASDNLERMRKKREAELSKAKTEYARYLKEIDELADSMRRIQREGKGKIGPNELNKLRRMDSQWRALNHEKEKIELKFQGELDSIQRKHNAKRAELSLKKFLETEKEKTRIARDEYAKRAAQYKKTNISRLQTYGGALDYSKQATTINRLIKANKYLEEARNRLSKTDADYQKKLSRLNEEIIKNKKEIDLATGKSEKLKKAHRGLMDVTGQLARRLALAFSISQITSYINRMVDVRGEFEMQQRSLQILLKDKEKANQLWDKTLALAIKSPFRVKELVTYTKQLAAYRVEADKLYQTNKMLADVSAGLGVDMNRLILAYGQVKAANYLRGTELRQFSEAGVNILEELAKYYSEIEKRTISVGDVFEMVSNRMVKFTDVEEIFHRITSEGGLFFNMQEEQSKTLKGMIMNLKDSYDIMFNEIGKDNNGIIRGALKLTKHLIDNWRVFLPLIKAAGFAYVSYFGVKSLLGTVRVLGEMQKKLLGVSKITSSIGKATPWLIVISAISALAGYLSTAANEANRLRAALNATEVEYMGLLQESIDSYIRLTKNINDSTKSTKERAAALSNLKSKFSGILPQEMLEEKYIKNISDNYGEATKAMRFYYNEKTRLQKEQKIESIFEEDISNEVSEIQKMYQKAANMTFRSGMLSQDELIRFNASISGVINDIVLKTKQGILEVDDFAENVKNKASEYTGISKDKLGFIFDEKDIKDAISNAYSSIDDGLGDLKNLFIEYRKEMNSVTGLQGESYAESEVAKAVQREQKNVDAFKQIYSDLVNSFTEYSKLIDEEAPSEVLDKKLKEIDIENNETFKSMPDRFKDSIRGMFNDMKVSADKGSYELKLTMKSIYAKYFEDFVNNLQLLIPNKADIVRVAKQVIHKISQAFKGEAKESKNSELTEILDDAFKAAVEATGGDLDIFSDIFSSANIEEALHSLESAWKRLRGLLSRFDNAVAAGTSKTDAARNIGLKFKDEAEALKQIAQMRKNLLALNFANKRLGGEDFDKKGSTKEESAALKRLKDQIKTLKDAYKEYTELRNHFDKEYSDAQMRDSFAERFSHALLGDVSDYDFSSKRGLLSALNTLMSDAKNINGGLKALLADISKTSMEIDLEADKNLTEQNVKKIEDMFGDYEISLELEKLDVPKDLAKRLFDLDAVSLGEIKKKLEEIKPEFDGEEDYKKYEEFLRKISEMEDRERVERLKKYSKYLYEAQTERVKIKLEELRKLEEIEKEDRFNETDKEVLRNRVKEEAEKGIAKADFEGFKNSSLYVQMFSDLDTVSNKGLKIMEEKLLSLQKNLKGLDPSELKEIQELLSSIEEKRFEINPFKDFGKNIVKSLTALKELNNQQEKVKKAQGEEEQQQQIVDVLTIQVQKAREFNAEVQEDEKASLASKVFAEDRLKSLEDSLKIAVRELAVKKGITEEEAEQLVLKQKQLSDSNKTINNIGNVGSQIIDSVSELQGMLENFGVDFGEDFSEILGGLGQVFGSLEQLDLTKPMSIVSSTVGVVAGLGNTIASIFGFGNKDKKKEKQIVKEIKFVEQLEKQYEKLGDAIEKAYSVDTLKESMDLSDKNIREQIKSREEMIQLEEDKKKTDHDRIKQWEEEIEDLQKRQEELHQQQVENMGGNYDYKSATEEFVNAWLDAYRETGDGLEGLKGKFKEFSNDLLLKQAVMGGASTIMKPLIDEINKGLEDDYKLSDSEWNSIDKVQNEQLGKLHEFLENFYGKYEGIFENKGSLSGLQESIQGITEETAQILEAYLSSVRLYVADTNNKFTRFLDSYMSEESENPMISQIRIIAKQTSAIRMLLDSVVKTGHSLGGSGIRVFMD